MTPSLTKVDFSAALADASPSLKRAFEASHEALRAAGIPHVVVGGLAVNALGHRYSTVDVDYLVAAQEAFEGSLVLTHKAGVPFKVGTVPIDYVTEDPAFPLPVREEMKANLAAARARPDKVVVVSDWLLVWMKLNAGRTKDVAAVEGLIQAGLDVASVRSALAEAGDARVSESFERCVKQAG